jgi:LmbE family N-acetylglucosaminyl deacetylase
MLKTKRLLVIAAHPDDDILGCGGLLAKYSKKIVIKVIFIAEGTSCRYTATEMSAKKTVIEDEIEKRNSYGIKALKYLGINSVGFKNFPCGRLDKINAIEINKYIEGEIKNFKPDTILTHSANDINLDHQIVFKSAFTAVRSALDSKVKNFICFEVLSSSEWSLENPFSPNYFIPLSIEDLTKKVNALEIYESEIRNYPHSRSAEGIKTLAKYRGMQSGTKYAEGLKIIRTID